MSYGALLYWSGFGIGLVNGVVLGLVTAVVITHRHRRRNENTPEQSPERHDVVAIAEAIVRDAAHKGEVQ